MAQHGSTLSCLLFSSFECKNMTLLEHHAIYMCSDQRAAEVVTWHFYLIDFRIFKIITTWLSIACSLLHSFFYFLEECVCTHVLTASRDNNYAISGTESDGLRDYASEIELCGGEAFLEDLIRGNTVWNILRHKSSSRTPVTRRPSNWSKWYDRLREIRGNSLAFIW